MDAIDELLKTRKDAQDSLLASARDWRDEAVGALQDGDRQYAIASALLGILHLELLKNEKAS